MRKVYICSRFRASEGRTVSMNILEALRGCKYALMHDSAPYAPHLVYPKILDDNIPEEREAGINAGLAFLSECDELWQWGLAPSEGMKCEIAFAKSHGIPIRVFDPEHPELTEL